VEEELAAAAIGVAALNFVVDETELCLANNFVNKTTR